MRKLLGIVLIINLFTLTGCVENIKKVESDRGITYSYEDVKDKLIRFHVLANSNSDEDQALKLKVKDNVIKYMEPILKKSESLEMTRELLKENKDKVQAIAEKIIKEEGYDYKVSIELKKENFPEKIYGNIILPQGEYEAFRILIGDYKGENWWCVMFPPLCFTDVTKGELSYEETEKTMDSMIDGNVAYEKEEDVKVKVKIFEVIKELF
ncbi:stage II sporulation protein R [Clostridium thermobutyricum]|uniref:Stage II sporulation protein SpoIIR n=1 Tax=Clostridium thermobutyricum DSM 4928 TaxID=1121339 RepID=A0A1V4SWW7_9CLOT|nr:stage II sporulation protein R [Clostridium thermobutyricum]OPX49027.1 stage II sporulation protein SpoIIR [Clostridium thermobutyricum DSM 4928]